MIGARQAPLRPVGPFGRTLTKGVVQPLIGGLDAELVDEVLSYLGAATQVLDIMMYTEDVVDQRFNLVGGASIRSDGKFYWRKELAEYVRLYRVALPVEFLDHCRASNWHADRVDLFAPGFAELERRVIAAVGASPVPATNWVEPRTPRDDDNGLK